MLSTDQRRALAMLATAGHNGATRPLLIAHGLGVSLIAGLVSRRLATLTHEKIQSRGKLVEVARLHITDAGRDALAMER